MRKPIFLSLTFCLLFLFKLQAQNTEIDSLIQLANLATPEEKPTIYNHLSSLYHFEDPQQTIDYAYLALSIAVELNNKEEEYSALRNIGSGYRMQGNNQKAIKYHLQAFDLSKEINKLDLIASVYIELGIDYAESGNFEKSTENFLNSLATYEAMLADSNDLVVRNNYALCLNNVAMNYDLLEMHDKSLEYYNKSMKISKEIGDDELLADVLNNIGLVYELKGEYNKSLDYLKQALAIHESRGNPRTIAIANANIALIYSSLEEYTKSLEYHKRTLKAFSKFEDPANEALAIVNVASTYIQMNQPEKAYPYIKDAIEMASMVQAKSTLRICYELLAEYYVKTNNYVKAFESQQKVIAIKDSLYKIELTENIAEMQTRYETQKKEQEIQLLTKDKKIQNLKLRKQRTQLWLMVGGILFLIVLAYFVFNSYKLRQQQYQTDLEKKNLETEQRMLRSQMNPHFIFNSMNSIQSYISGNDNFTAMTYLSKFAQLMRGILENSRQVMISFEEEITTLNLYIELEQLRFKNKFEFKLTIEPELHPDITYIPPMLVQPFAENAIKHGLKNKDGNGLLQINFTKKDRLIECVIEDNGIGREQANALNKNKSKDHQSLGMQVTRERLEGLKRDKNVKSELSIIDLTNDEGKAAGTRVIVTFPFEEE